MGCLLWVTLNVMGPELLRVKDLARLSNSYGEDDYNMALKVLQRTYVRRHHGIVIFRHAAGKEIIPSSTRLTPTPVSGESSGENGSFLFLTTLGLIFSLQTMRSRKIVSVTEKFLSVMLPQNIWSKTWNIWISNVILY